MLTGDAILLRQFIEGDIELLTSLRNNIELQEMLMAAPRPNSPQRVVEWLSRRLNDPQAVFFVIAQKADNHPIGYVQVTQIDFIHGLGELGVCLEKESQGLGFGAEVLDLLERYLSDVFHLRKLTLKVLLSNARAISLYTKAGFKKVGVYAKHHYYRQDYHDVLLMEKFLPGDDAKR